MSRTDDLNRRRRRLSSHQRLLAVGIAGAGVLAAILLLIVAKSAPEEASPTPSPAVIAAVHAAVRDSLTEENGGFVIDPHLRHRAATEARARLLSAESLRSRTTGFERSRSSSLATGLRRAFVFYVNSEFTDRISSAFRDLDVWASSRFHPDHWYPVHQHGSTVRIRVRGENRGLAWNGKARADAQATYSLTLTRDRFAPHGWRLTQETATSTAA